MPTGGSPLFQGVEIQQHDVVIVGAGPAGLSTAACLGRLGHRPLVIEQGPAPGAGWRARPASLILTTPRSIMSLPYLGIQKSLGTWLTATQWTDYLETYARLMNISVYCGTRVHGVEPSNDGWIVRAAATSFHARAVVVASGQDRLPRFPVIEGIADYDAPLFHSSALPPILEPRRNTLIIGAGTSACELAHTLSHQGHTVTMSIRSVPVVLPRQAFGVATARLGVCASLVPGAAIDAIARLTQHVFFGSIPWGAEANQRRLSERRRIRYAPTIDNGFVRALKDGLVQIVPRPERFLPKTVVFADGQEAAFDIIVAATGYRHALNEFIGVAGVLDALERPISPKSLLRVAPGLFFVGLRPRLTPLHYALRHEARRVAVLVHSLISGASAVRPPSNT